MVIEENNGAATLPDESGSEVEARDLEDEETPEPEAPAEGDGTSAEGTATAAQDPIDAMDEDKMDAILFARDASLINKNLTEDQKRAELKKFRAIDSRAKGKEAEKPKDAPMTVGDFEKVNQKNAIRESTTALDTDTDEVKAIKADIDENWDRVRMFYTPRRGKKTTQDIVQDILDAHALWKRSEGKPAKEESPAGDLATHSGARPGAGGAPAPKPNLADKFSKPKGPDNWYPKKQG